MHCVSITSLSYHNSTSNTMNPYTYWCLLYPTLRRYAIFSSDVTLLTHLWVNTQTAIREAGQRTDSTEGQGDTDSWLPIRHQTPDGATNSTSRFLPGGRGGRVKRPPFVNTAPIVATRMRGYNTIGRGSNLPTHTPATSSPLTLSTCTPRRPSSFL